MRNHFPKLVVCAAFVGLQLAVPVKNLQAGPFLDWLLGRPILTYPSQPTVAAAAVPVLAPASAVTTAGYPATASHQVAPGYPYPLTTNYAATTAAPAACPCPVTANYAAAPTTACATPCAAAPATTAYLPVVAQPAQYLNPTVVGYSPTYRSSWYRVPVTYYRPVTAYTGVAAQPVTVMQPCNTQTYQVRRSPLLFHRPWLPATTTVPYAAYAPVVTQPAPMVTGQMVTAQPSTAPNCPCPNAATVAPSLSTTPYYGPSTTVPSTTFPSTVAPSTHIPSSSDPVPGSSTMPADQAPALQQIDPAAGAYPNSASLPSHSAATTASTQRTFPNPKNTASSVYQVKPIPDPQLNQPASPARVVAPPLLNPRERTASQSSAKSLAVTQAVYKTPIATSAAPTTQAPAKRQLWDDSGWHSAGR
jgi:hypothetical protein